MNKITYLDGMRLHRALVAGINNELFKGRLFLWLGVFSGITPAILGISTNIPIALLGAFAMGATQAGFMTLTHSMIQTIIPDGVRGRVGSVYSVHVGGMMALSNGDADGLVAGAITPTSEVIRSSIRMIGIHDNSNCVSSIFFMISEDNKQYFTYSDCGVIPEPDVKQLVDIAYNASNFHTLLSNEEAKVAFLSFSTKGSAEHYRVEKVKEAVKLFGRKHKDI